MGTIELSINVGNILIGVGAYLVISLVGMAVLTVYEIKSVPRVHKTNKAKYKFWAKAALRCVVFSPLFIIAVSDMVTTYINKKRVDVKVNRDHAELEAERQAFGIR